MNDKEVFKQLNIKEIQNGPTGREVSIFGMVNGFFLYKYKSYWILHGEMPVEKAIKLKTIGNPSDIRIFGGGGDSDPMSEATSSRVDIFVAKQLESLKLKGIKEFGQVCNDFITEQKEENPQEFYVETYHIDSLEGLNTIVKFIRDENIITVR